MATTRRLNPEKLLLSKWTAAAPRNREKHFLVVALGRPAPDAPVETVTLEAVHSRRRQTMAWQALRDTDQWRQGWQ
ncbi:TIGR02450 family Trp-rich protein [Chromobacterium violaceum]|uniref:TIGR02450 family Trp-rich protein n=1 Tax=Chromobacterium violaceum TaxID=536 RepID=UPI0005BD9019|nr:TIGR02450 family Trp-rich protein [Chromobacterium violaceum]